MTALPGCTPTPLAAYLKALGSLRILGQQRPGCDVKGSWNGNVFQLSGMEREAILKFFLSDYVPSPIVAPWNGGSGFHPSDNSTALNTIVASSSPRFAPYRETISTARSVLATLSLKEKPGPGDKERLMLGCRSAFSELAVEWLDSAFVLTEDGTRYPPLLGTGGNDGRLEFTNNFMQRLTEVFDVKTGEPATHSAALLESALWGTPVKGHANSPIGQFSPAASGGANASTGFDSKSFVNPWDFILALEGAMLFGAAAVKRLEGFASGQLVYPFCVRASGAGYGSSSDSDEKDARCEIWMPLWNQPCGLAEIKNVLGEGRGWVGGRVAKNGVDFAQATASLGVDRGISEFQRYGFHVRNGLAYFATPLQRLRVRRDNVIGDLLAACDEWVSTFLYRGGGDDAPASIRRAANGLEAAIFAQASSAQVNNPETAQELLMALGQCERALANSQKWREEAHVLPIPPLDRGWIQAADTGRQSEYRLAASLASMGVRFSDFFVFRRHLEPVRVIPRERAWAVWDEDAKNEVATDHGGLTEFLLEIMRRRLLMAKSAGMKSWQEPSKLTAWPSDIAAFIEGRIDEQLLIRLLWGLCLVDFAGDVFTEATMPRIPEVKRASRSDNLTRAVHPPALYAQLKLCFANLEDKDVPIEPIIFNLAANGDGERASRQALRRLHGSNVPITHIRIPLNGDAAKRCAAALLFPLWRRPLAEIGKAVAPALFEL